MIELTEQQRMAIRNGEAIRIAVPEIGEDMVLLLAAQYERLKAAFEDHCQQRSILRYSMKQATKVAKENTY